MKLHLGCGKRELKGCTHVDLADFPHIDVRAAIDDLSHFEDSSAELIYSCHAFEYFDREDAPRVLNEWRRVLKPGGVLRLAVPDFEALVAVYLESADISRVLGPLYGRWPVPGTELTVYHKTTYDFASLKNLLEENGFQHTKRWDWQEVFRGEWEGFDDYSQAYYPHMDKENGRLMSLNVEALKV